MRPYNGGAAEVRALHGGGAWRLAKPCRTEGRTSVLPGVAVLRRLCLAGLKPRSPYGAHIAFPARWVAQVPGPSIGRVHTAPARHPARRAGRPTPQRSLHGRQPAKTDAPDVLMAARS